MSILIGQLVISIAGRDAGHPYLVAGIDKHYVFLTDGRERTVVKPKKKNVRHVKVHKSIAEAVAEKIQQGQKVTNEDIRQAIANLYTG